MRRKRPRTRNSQTVVNDTRIPAWLSKYFHTNPAGTVWQAALGIGGIILAIHFAYIGFFPDLDWQSSLVLLAIIALTGLFIWVFICLVMVFPSYVWSMVLEDMAQRPIAAQTVRQEDTAKENSETTDDRTTEVPHVGKSENSPEGPGIDKGMSLPFRLSLLFGFPPLLFCIFAAALIWGGGEASFENPFSLLVIFVGTILLATVCVYRYTSSVRVLGPRYQTLSFGRYFIAVFFGSVVIGIPIIFMSAFVYSRYNPNPWRAAILIVAIFLGFLYNLFAFRRWLDDSQQKRTGTGFPQAISVGSIFLVSLLAMTGTWVLIPEGMASLYSIGNIEGATLLLTKEGCSTVEGLGLRKKPELNEECRLDDVKILNRLGATYYIKTPEGVTFTLPSSSVKTHKVQAPVWLEVNIEQAGDTGGNKLLKVTLTNSSTYDIDDVTARVELLDGDGHLRQTDRSEAIDIPAGQTREIKLALPLPSYTGERNYYVFLSRHGRELSYKRKW